jgi:hypothetical protein
MPGQHGNPGRWFLHGTHGFGAAIVIGPLALPARDGGKAYG